MAYDNKSIYEQLGSGFAQQAGLLDRRKSKRNKKNFAKLVISSLFSNAAGAFKTKLTEDVATKISNLTKTNTWDSNYDVELWKQGSQIKAVDSLYQSNPSYFRGIAKQNIMDSDFGIKFTQAGGVANFNKAESKVYQELIDFREKELVANHEIRMANPTAEFETFKQFSDGTRDMLATQLKNIKDDPANRNVFFGLMRQFGVGKDKEIELEAEIATSLEAQTKRWKAAEAFIAPLKVTKFIDYDTTNDKQAFTLGRNINSVKKDAEISKLILNLQSPGDKSTFDDIKFTALSENDAGKLGGKSNGIATWTNGNETGAELLALRTESGSPFTEEALENMEVYYNKGMIGGVQAWDKTKKIENASTYIAQDVYTISQQIAVNQPGLSEEMRHSMAVQFLVESGNIRKTDKNMILAENYIYVPLNRSISPENSLNSDEDNMAAKLEALKAAEYEQLLKDTPKFLDIINPYFEQRQDVADESGDVEELTILQALSGGDKKVRNEESLKFIFNPPEEFVGKSVVLNIGVPPVPEVIELGTGNKDTYQSMYKFHEETYGENNVLKSFLNRESTEEEPSTKVPKPIKVNNIDTTNLEAKTLSEISNMPTSRERVGLLFDGISKRPARTMSAINEALARVDNAETVRDLKVYDSKINREVKKAYIADTGNKLTSVFKLTPNEYAKYLRMYKEDFMQSNRNLFNESEPKSLLDGN